MKSAARWLSLIGWGVNLLVQLLYLLQSLGILLMPHRGVLIAFSQALGLPWLAGVVWALVGLAVIGLAYKWRRRSTLLILASAALYLAVWYRTGPLAVFGLRGLPEAFVAMKMFGLLPLFLARDVLLPALFTLVLVLVAASALRGRMQRTGSAEGGARRGGTGRPAAPNPLST